MRMNVAQQPKRLEMVVFDGTNDEEVTDYIADANDPTGIAEVRRDENGNAYIGSSFNDDKPISSGAFVHAVAHMWGGPGITVYTPTEANMNLYHYPTFEPVAEGSATP